MMMDKWRIELERRQLCTIVCRYMCVGEYQSLVHDIKRQTLITDGHHCPLWGIDLGRVNLALHSTGFVLDRDDS